MGDEFRRPSDLSSPSSVVIEKAGIPIDQFPPTSSTDFSTCATVVTDFLVSTPLFEEWSEARQVLLERLSSTPHWQLALPIASCRAVNAAPAGATLVAAAWSAMHQAALLIDAVQDSDSLPSSRLGNPQATISVAIGLISAAFRILEHVEVYPGASRLIAKLFAEAAFRSSRGQYLCLTQHLEDMPVAEALQAYWFRVISKSGSIFWAAAAGGAAAGTDSEHLIAALGDFGNCIGVIRQIMDDCSDVLPGTEAAHCEISLPLLAYSLDTRKQILGTPSARLSGKALFDLFTKADVPLLVTDVLLEWRQRALRALSCLEQSEGVAMLQVILHQVLTAAPTSSQIENCNLLAEHDDHTQVTS